MVVVLVGGGDRGSGAPPRVSGSGKRVPVRDLAPRTDDRRGVLGPGGARGGVLSPVAAVGPDVAAGVAGEARAPVASRVRRLGAAALRATGALGVRRGRGRGEGALRVE